MIHRSKSSLRSWVGLLGQLGLFVLAGSVTGAWAGATLDRIKATGVVNMGFREAGLPFSYKAADGGAPLGYSIDICNALIEAVKLEIKVSSVQVNYVPVTGSTRIPSIVDGKTDMECANTTNTKARREQVAFSMPHYFAAAKLVVRADSGIKRLDDMKGKVLAVNKGSTSFLIAEARKLRGLTLAKIIVVENSLDGVKALEDKQADGYMNDDILLFGFKAQSKQALAVVGAGMSVEPLAVMFSKTDAELNALVTREMSRLYTSGKMRELYRKWFQSPLPQRSFNLNVSPNPLTADMFSRPSSYTVDWVVL
jgi:glutamate/aspartate transport system substrate-binding protein